MPGNTMVQWVLPPPQIEKNLEDNFTTLFKGNPEYAQALGRASARFFLQFMPPGTKWAYWTRPRSGISGSHVRLRVGEFRRTARGRAVYDAAPEDAKRFYSRCVGNANPLDPRQVYDLYRTMDDASWDYILAHAWTPAQRKDLSDTRTHMQGHPAGTKMFWWLQ